MRKIFSAVVATAICSVTFISAHAQKMADNDVTSDLKSVTADVATAQPATETKTYASSPSKIAVKAIKDFKKTYSDVLDETWEASENGYVARFVVNSVRTMNYYSKKGVWVHSITYYDETKLNESVRASVKSVYEDYSITSVQEINTDKNNCAPTYVVHIAADDVFKTIRVYKDEMEEIEL